jgi:hypothetical protein
MTRLRFSIRDLLWLTALCAVVVAWWIEHSRLTAEVERLKLKPFISWVEAYR